MLKCAIASESQNEKARKKTVINRRKYIFVFPSANLLSASHRPPKQTLPTALFFLSASLYSCFIFIELVASSTLCVLISLWCTHCRHRLVEGLVSSTPTLLLIHATWKKLLVQVVLTLLTSIILPFFCSPPPLFFYVLTPSTRGCCRFLTDTACARLARIDIHVRLG